MTQSSCWEFMFALPNLALPDFNPDDPDDGSGEWRTGLTLSTEVASITRSNDPRVSTIAASSHAVRTLVGAFTNERGAPIRPSCLIVREDVRVEGQQVLPALVAFRNAVAFSFLLPARAHLADDAPGFGVGPSWSDTFDFYPIIIGRNDALITDTDGQLAIHTWRENGADRFFAMPSPHLPQFSGRMTPDRALYDLLGREWRRLYLARDPELPRDRALFRSLEVAYQASSIAVKNQGALSEYGVQVAMWVSALEILAWPRRTGARVRQSDVLAMLGEYEWRSAALDEPRYIVKLDKEQPANAVQWIASNMYRARNAFLHGNAVGPATLLPEGLVGLPLTALAALVYRTALIVDLRARYPANWDDPAQVKELMRASWNEYAYRSAFEKALGAKPRRR